MSLEQSLCFYLPPPIMFACCVGGPMLLALLGLCIFRKIVPLSFLKQNHDVTGPFFSTLGTVYGIFLAFVCSSTWQAFSSTSNNLVQEARYLGDLYFAAKAFPQPQQKELQQLGSSSVSLGIGIEKSKGSGWKALNYTRERSA
jgi:hypothetical protein